MQPVPRFRVEISRDGSHTVFSEAFNQFFHNPNGAVDESLHVFFETSGLARDIRAGRALRIFETGFGTGLNALLLADLLLESGNTSPVVFQSIEAWPLDPETASALNYSRFLKNPKLWDAWPGLFRQLQQGNARIRLTPSVEIRVFRGTFEAFCAEKDSFVLPHSCDYFLHDAFSPEANPELWSVEVFRALYEMALPEAVLTTYCAATRARAAMAAAGWFVARAPGALGKREMTIASRDPNKLVDRDRLDESRLIGKLQG